MLLEAMLSNTQARAYIYIQAILGFDKNNEGFFALFFGALSLSHLRICIFNCTAKAHTLTRKKYECYALAQTKRNILQRHVQIVELLLLLMWCFRWPKPSWNMCAMAELPVHNELCKYDDANMKAWETSSFYVIFSSPFFTLPRNLAQLRHDVWVTLFTCIYALFYTLSI